VAVFIGAWYAIGRTGAISPLFVPRIEASRMRSSVWCRRTSFWSAVRVTVLHHLGRLYLIAVLLGRLERISGDPVALFDPAARAGHQRALSIQSLCYSRCSFSCSESVPASKVAYGAAYGFFPIALNTIAGFSGVDERYRNAARSMGISAFGTFRHVLLPAASL